MSGFCFRADEASKMCPRNLSAIYAEEEVKAEPHKGGALSTLRLRRWGRQRVG